MGLVGTYAKFKVFEKVWNSVRNALGSRRSTGRRAA
jgi:hypothetical protein